MSELELLLRKITLIQEGFLTNEDVEQLALLDRLRQVLVRCGCGRILTAAQSARHYADLIDSSDGPDYVRDMSLPTSDKAYQYDWQPVTNLNGREAAVPRATAEYSDTAQAAAPRYAYPHVHEDYGGAFDGFNVTSDADPGL